MNRLILVLSFMVLSFSSQAVFSYSNSGAVAQNTSSYNPNRPITKVISYNYLAESEIQSMVGTLFPNVRVHVNSTKKLAMLLGDRNDLEKIESLVKNMDISKQTIEYSICLIEINHNELQKIGVDWQQVFEQWKLGQVTNVKQLMSQMTALLKNGEAKILANPVVISLVDEEASIKVGDKIPYSLPVEYSTKSSWQLQYMDCGLQMKIKGKVISENIVQTHIFTNISNIKEWKALQNGEYPVLSNREVDLLCQIKSGQSIILGGLTNSSNRKNVNTIPIIGSIPLIGSLFKSETVEKEETEVVFVLTPEIKKL